MKALSVRQPFAWGIIHAGKPIENRDWPDGYPPLRFRGRVLLHASKGCTRAEYGDACAFMHEIGVRDIPELDDLPRGAIVGAMTIADVVKDSSSPWFVGPVGLVLRDVVALREPVPCKGALGYFEVPEDVATKIRAMFGRGA